VKIETKEPVRTNPAETITDIPQKKPAEAGSTNSPAADNAQNGGKTADASKLQAWLAQVRARIAKAKRYPMMAERRRIQGEVVVSFRLGHDGRLQDEPQIAESSGSSLLDGASIRAVKRAAPFPRFPGPLEKMPTEPLSVELDFIIR
jgi:protein TonB